MCNVSTVKPVSQSVVLAVHRSPTPGDAFAPARCHGCDGHVTQRGPSDAQKLTEESGSHCLCVCMYGQRSLYAPMNEGSTLNTRNAREGAHEHPSIHQHFGPHAETQSWPAVPPHPRHTHTHTHTHSNPPTHHSIAYPRHTTHTTHERDTKLAHTPRGPIHPSIHLDK
mmetsp:Transcript_16148/g.38626  ORF Transcript_16148/g.38626 Transcript_16148/m.38626 type:complete len:168 (+) Transcript_16148:534-1037(+)